jgi:hypothetical protein
MSVELSASWVATPSLSLPRKGGGNPAARTFAPHTMCLRQEMCASRSASAGTTAEYVDRQSHHSFNSFFAFS